MQKQVLSKAELYAVQNRRRHIWQRIVQCLACIVVFCTTYALILPAITMEGDVFCGQKEHKHTVECYVQIKQTAAETEIIQQPDVIPETELICSIHTHTAACMDGSGAVACGQEGQTVHIHSDTCYVEEPMLVCQTQETEMHTHTESCYIVKTVETHAHSDICYTTVKGDLICGQQETEGHSHGDSCFVSQRGALQCTSAEGDGHSHGDGCYTSNTSLVCGQDESAGHTHTAECKDENGNVICGQNESAGHSHSDACYQTNTTLTCSQNEWGGHWHSDGCYAWDRVLNCGQQETAAHYHNDSCYAWNQVLSCGQAETVNEAPETELACSETVNIVHTHTEECYEMIKSFICQLPEVTEHVHSESCYRTVQTEAPKTETKPAAQPETEPLTCKKDHKHKEMCYGTWELICKKEEHEHDLICHSDKEADLETPAVWERTMANVRLTGNWPEDLIAIAETQLGYTESKKNYLVEEGKKIKGYTRYGAWYGSPYGDWCAMFASFCMNYAEIKEVPLDAGCANWVSSLNYVGLYRNAGSYVPAPGDLIFFENNSSMQGSDHVGIVTKVVEPSGAESGRITTIEGNSSNKVQNVTYSYNDSSILGFADMRAAQDAYNHRHGITDPDEIETEAIETETEEKVTEGSETELNSEANAEDESETGTENESELESESETENESESESESGTENESESESESGTENESESESELGTENESESESESGTENESESESESGTENESESESEFGTEVESETEIESETETLSSIVIKAVVEPYTEETDTETEAESIHTEAIESEELETEIVESVDLETPEDQIYEGSLAEETAVESVETEVQTIDPVTAFDIILTVDGTEQILTLTDEESAEITDIPAGIEFTVREAAPEGYIVTYLFEESEYLTADATGVSGITTAGTAAVITVVNTELPVEEPMTEELSEEQESETETETETEIAALLDDSAAVSELHIDNIIINNGTEKEAEESTSFSEVSVSADKDIDSLIGTLSISSVPQQNMLVENGGTIQYDFTVNTASYSDASFSEGRVKLEFVLPLTETQASFDLTEMTWLDNSEGYTPVLSVENRVIDGEEVSCQVLAGYKYLKAEETSETDAETGETVMTGVIPGTFQGSVKAAVYDMENGETVQLFISAAMEYGTWDGICEEHQQEEKITVPADEVTVFAEEVKNETPDIVGEMAEGTNWMRLRDSGWFQEYSGAGAYEESAVSDTYELYSEGSAEVASVMSLRSSNSITSVAEGAVGDSVDPSDVQVDDVGGSTVSDDGKVTVSKTIDGTDLENVFDITLKVETQQKLSEVYEDPDMAVVIVMDISQTMNSAFGDSTRYKAAMDAAEDFIDEFAAESNGISKIGYVAFNTHAHEIFDLSPCSSTAQADALKDEMRSETGVIINQTKYEDSHDRFTNVEAGLKRGYDMLKEASNDNKYLIFLSDGFPTTYIKSGYTGWDPYCEGGTIGNNGVFYDSVFNVYCELGTSYSDKAAIRAREMAEDIKENGVNIFSIGVDVAGQTIKYYIDASRGKYYSIVDRTGTTYEIGDAESTAAYKDWLRDSIGSGYYYDSTNTAGLSEAYEKIFAEIQKINEEASIADWVASDPLPQTNGVADTVEFIGFYNKNKQLITNPALLNGKYESGGENTAVYDSEDYQIDWDLKNSGYTSKKVNNVTTYTYELVYRVRLKNEVKGFEQNDPYPTNNPTSLTYKVIETVDGEKVVSETRTIDFKIPEVHGWTEPLSFTKVDSYGNPLSGAKFELKHDTKNCSKCKGDNKSYVPISSVIQTSDENGKVKFSKIPSGHKYILTEIEVPAGYVNNGNTYDVTIAYNKLKVTVKSADGTILEWDEKIINNVYYELPQTGGPGSEWYTLGGLMLTVFASILMYIENKRKRRKEDFTSF